MLTFTAACFHVDIYESASLSPASMKLFIQLQEHVSRETDYMKHFIQIEGMLHILLASVNTHNDTTASSTNNPLQSMTPSLAAANANLIYSVG